MLAVKTLKGAGWLILSRTLGRSIDFFTLLILARLLAPTDFGTAALAISLVAIVDMVLEVPVTQALVRLPSIDKTHLDTGFTISCVRGLLTSTIILLAAWPFSVLNNDPVLASLICFLALGPVCRGLVSPAMVHYSRNLGFRRAFALELSSKICATIVVLIVVLSGGGYWAIVANFVVVSIASTIASYVLAPYRPAFSFKQLSSFTGFIGWYSLSQLIAALNWQFDRLLVGSMSSRTTFGNYTVAGDVSVLPTQTVIGPAMQSVMAAFSQINDNPERLRQAFLKAVRLVMLVSTPICVGISMSADIVTDLLLGAKWHEAAPLLSLLAIAVLPIPYFQVLVSLGLSLDKARSIFRLNLIDLCFRVVFIGSGVYFASVTGASYARIFLAFLMGYFYIAGVRELIGLGVLVQLRNLWKIGCAVVLMAIAVHFLRDAIASRDIPIIAEMAIVGAIGSMVYLATLYGLGMRLSRGAGRLEVTG